jgi:hypothetical protein
MGEARLKSSAGQYSRRRLGPDGDDGRSGSLEWCLEEVGNANHNPENVDRLCFVINAWRFQSRVTIVKFDKSVRDIHMPRRHFSRDVERDLRCLVVGVRCVRDFDERV